MWVLPPFAAAYFIIRVSKQQIRQQEICKGVYNMKQWSFVTRCRCKRESLETIHI